jgi:hypothetical protein
MRLPRSEKPTRFSPSQGGTRERVSSQKIDLSLDRLSERACAFFGCETRRSTDQTRFIESGQNRNLSFQIHLKLKT